ncbi:hypothetical protein IAQ61_009672 [Plenodomus lingam]|nr:hypothetical protein IAQ61_009672 [Plenodomus lingam]
MMQNTVASKKESSASTAQSINATPFRRYLTLLAVKLLKRIRKSRGPVIFLSSKICVKCGGQVTLNEASTMQFVAQHTSIPVPRVYCAFKRKGRVYIVMERIQGEPIGAGWYKRSEESKAKLLEQLKRMIEEMRSITPPEGVGVAHVNGGPLYAPRLPGTYLHSGPFSTIQDFHSYLRFGIEAHPEHKPEISELISRQEKVRDPPVFTHGDLSSFNILVSGDEIVGIIDWETAGWYPSYWEYTSAWDVNPYNEFWRDEVGKFIQPMPEELEMERVRLEYFGDV